MAKKIIYPMDRTCLILLMKENDRLRVANQRLVEALISKNAVDYAVAQKLINDMNRPAPAPQQSGPQSMEQNLNDVVDHESQFVASPVEG